ncbi:MAG: benzoyl-CoA 2,3-epoxidase subunit BoxB, partial [Planctomycetota bacterium]
REEYMNDCERALRKWNRTLEKTGIETRLKLPSRRFHRHQGMYSDHFFNPAGELITEEQFEKNKRSWLLMPEDNDYILSIMHQVTEPGKMANWIAIPARGTDGKPLDFEYVRT